ncbi:hypothetical protein V9L05_20500 [Bernardetia sp. Wsw4-3y2]|uniref:hypothetical protein n=1 Tax=Bernardetia sp. Wsw4-3y2 TaxID=3127471 RepID=UPI0030D44378
MTKEFKIEAMRKAAKEAKLAFSESKESEYDFSLIDDYYNFEFGVKIIDGDYWLHSIDGDVIEIVDSPEEILKIIDDIVTS